jgi:hypothetical protein
MALVKRARASGDVKKVPGTSRPGTVRYAGPGTYRIEIEGKLSADWEPRLGDLRMTSWRSEDGGRLTVLKGRVRDQAALAGILNTIYELHVPLLSVQRLDDDTSPGDTGR